MSSCPFYRLAASTVLLLDLAFHIVLTIVYNTIIDTGSILYAVYVGIPAVGLKEYVLVNHIHVSVKNMQCSELRGLDNVSTTCDFVRCVHSCSNEDGLINYLLFLYCQVPSRFIPAVMVFLVSVSCTAK